MVTASEPPRPARPVRLVRPGPLEWLYLAVGLALVVRYRWIFDDSFVYFRYVDNLLFLDAGLTFNAGEYVEGFSSPLHCILLALPRALRLGYPLIVLLVGVASFTAFWYLLVVLNRAWRPELSAARACNFPLAYLAASYSVTSFFSAGNEAPLVHVVAAANALLLLRPRSRLLAAVVALGPLVRPELVLSLGLTAAYLWGSAARFPRFLVGVAVAANGAWLLFRVWYYADLLPNTFYLKTGTSIETSTNLDAGLRYLRNATEPYGFALVFGVFAVLAAGLAFRARGTLDLAIRPRVAMLGIAAVMAAAVVVTGGSAMHYYYLAFPLTLAVCALGGMLEMVLARLRPTRGLAGRAVVMVAITAAVFSRYPALTEHPVTGNEVMAELPSLEVMTDPSFFRHQEKLAHQWPSIDELRAFAPRLRADGYASATDAIWCNTMYANFRTRAVHPYGLTDAILARVDTPEAKRGHKPALAPLARDLIRLQVRAGAVGRGVYTDAIGAGTAPAWMEANRATIEVLERKMYQEHDLLENLQLAFTFPQPIRL